MTSDELIAEGRALQRPCELLVPTSTRNPIAIWHSDSTRLLSFATDDGGYIAILRGDELRAERIPFLPTQMAGDVALNPISASVLPPIDAVFAYGSEKVGTWLEQNKWTRQSPYNDNFPDHAVTDAYQRQFQREHPIYSGGGMYAVRGGWHFPFPDDDWAALASEQLLVMTIRDAEPWVEVWRAQNGALRAMARIT